MGYRGAEKKKKSLSLPEGYNVLPELEDVSSLGDIVGEFIDPTIRPWWIGSKVV